MNEWHYINCEFSAGGQAYTYKTKQEGLKLGDYVVCEVRGKKMCLPVLREITEEEAAAKFPLENIKPIFGLVAPEDFASEDSNSV